MLQRLLQELDYRLDMCRVKGCAHTELLGSFVQSVIKSTSP